MQLSRPVVSAWRNIPPWNNLHAQVDGFRSFTFNGLLFHLVFELNSRPLTAIATFRGFHVNEKSARLVRVK